jgi:Predicted membrane protein (DUF2142)
VVQGRLISARQHAPLVLVLSFALVQALAWTIITPAFQGPDEDAHFAYTQSLVERHRLPAFAGGGQALSTEFITASKWADLQPTRGNPSARTGWSAAEEEAWRQAERALTAAQRADGTGENPAAENPPLYYVYESIPYWLGLHTSRASFFTRLELMRLANIPLYLLTILFVWLGTFEALGRRWAATLAACAVTLVPEFGFLAATVNPDVALAAEWSGFVYFALRIVKRGVGVSSTLALVVCATAALFTQPRSLALLPITAVVLGIAPKLSKREWTIAGVAAAVVAGFSYASYSFTRAHTTPDSPVFSGAHGSLSGFLSYLWQFYLPRLPGMPPMLGPAYGASTAWVERFFGDLGWLEIGFPAWVNTALRAATLALVVAVAVGLVVRRGGVRRQWRVVVVLAAALGCTLGLLHVVAYLSLLGNPADPIVTGRYLFPLLTVWGTAVAASISLLPRRLAPTMALIVVAGGAGLDLLAFTLALERFYA